MFAKVVCRSGLVARSARLCSVRAAQRSLPLLTALRACSATAAPPAGQQQSAVNVEEFTLNDEVVQRDMENMRKWNELSEALEEARQAANYAAVLEHVQAGLARLKEVGALNAPIQAECLLCMEGAQAHFNMKQLVEAEKMARQAKVSLMADRPELRDNAQLAEIDQFIGFVLCDQGKPKEAHAVFEEVLRWIDVDAKSAMPMQAVAAVNLRRTVVTGVGRSLALLAEQKAAADGAAKEEFGKALDILIDALNLHIDENDFEMVKTTLHSILKCFEGIGDAQQAVTTCRKYISWCSRHEDAVGVKEGEELLADLCKRHNIEDKKEE